MMLAISETFLEPVFSSVQRSVQRSLRLAAPLAPQPHWGHWRGVSRIPFVLKFPKYTDPLALVLVEQRPWIKISSQDHLREVSKIIKFGLHNAETSKDCPSSKRDVLPWEPVAYDHHSFSGTTYVYESEVAWSSSAASSAASLVASSAASLAAS